MKTNILHISLPNSCLQEAMTFHFQLFLLYITLFKLTAFHCIVYLILMKFEIFSINFYVQNTAVSKHEDLVFQFFLVHALPPQLRPENLPNHVYQIYFMLKLLLFLKIVSSSQNQEDILGESLGARIVQLQADCQFLKDVTGAPCSKS